MIYLKKYGLRLLYTLTSLFICLLLLTTIYYFNLISPNTYKILKIIILLVNIFISGYILGKKANNKGYLEGLKLALIIIPIFFILTLLTTNGLEVKLILYYFIILFTSIFGSMFGISKKRN